MSNNAYKRASQLIQKAKGPKWKRELVSDHKFDFIDIEEFRDQTCLLTIRYFILFCSVLISCAVYCADLGSAGILLIYNRWSLSTQPKIPFYISKWIYVGCIAISFILLAWEIRKARSVMETRDISLAVTNPLAYKTYSIRSYSHFCLLQRIKNSTKWSDVIIFYVFYTLKGWKKIIVAQGPRQIIAGITVYALLKSAWTGPNGEFEFSDDWDTYGQDWPQRVSLMLMSFTCVLWIISALQIVLAVLLYFPILCQIQGNLKEYCCHKIDKRIDELLEKQRKKRIREREKYYTQSINSKKSKKSNKKGSKNENELEVVPALPTLPVINNLDIYPGNKKIHPWLYQQLEQQNSYYDSQPMTPLESTYSLQRNNTKYSPYNETPFLPHQQTNAYTQQQDITTNYYYHSSAETTQQQYNDYITSNRTYCSGSIAADNKPHEYDDQSSPKFPNSLTNNGNTAKYNKNHYQSTLPTSNTEVLSNTANTAYYLRENSYGNRHHMNSNYISDQQQPNGNYATAAPFSEEVNDSQATNLTYSNYI